MKSFSTEWYKEQCALLRIYPEKNRGQHFLIDQSVIETMMEQIQSTQNNTIIEIGPGFGPLTSALANISSRIHVFEIEKKFETSAIITQLITNNKIIFHNEDITAVDETNFPQPYNVISNLPYNISSAIITKFLTSATPPKEMMLMLQKEVGEKLCAQPPDTTRLSILAQTTCSIKKICDVPRSAFWPQPKIDSVVMHFTNIALPPHVETLQMLTKIAFAQKRKKIMNTLGSLTPEIKKIFAEANIDPNSRPEELSVQDWLRCAQCYDSISSSLI